MKQQQGFYVRFHLLIRHNVKCEEEELSFSDNVLYVCILGLNSKQA